MEWKIGEVAVSAFLTVILGLIYKTIGTESDTLKGWIALLCGVAIGYVMMIYQGVPATAKSLIEFLFAGAQVGFTSIGIFRLVKGDIPK